MKVSLLLDAIMWAADHSRKISYGTCNWASQDPQNLPRTLPFYQSGRRCSDEQADNVLFAWLARRPLKAKTGLICLDVPSVSSNGCIRCAAVLSHACSPGKHPHPTGQNPPLSTWHRSVLPRALSVMVDMYSSCSVQYSSHHLHVVPEHLK